MTDLQCAAVVVLLGIGAPLPAWLGRLKIAETVDAPAQADVCALVDDAADRFRGETLVLAAPAPALVAALRAHGISGAPPVIVGVDSEGWTVRSP
ncbi:MULTISPECIES: hypothetical protein [unclassified Arthrobacter]|uniref:hypothetical protein n=1 Tax=unclassified Arthrobacter TaxID=235627 RepID=UPI0006F680E6|nr:hypothetical protein [Arthrobacter sp. Leaf234]KQO00913.1 hypothetical protein ASF21_11480 [Arthrobacter sp. Leaf234]